MNPRLLLPALASAAMLLGALAEHSSYDYYMAMRWVVTVSATWIALVAYQTRRELLMWGFMGAAILFNPVAMITMSKDQWQPIDVVAAFVFLSAPFAIRERNP